MSFSRRQQGHFQPLKQRAWLAVCRREQIDPQDKAAARAWYEQELFYATRHTSTTECDGKRDFEYAMAHFEALADESIYWQMRKHGGDKRRIIHEIRQLSEGAWPFQRHIAPDFDCPEDYLRAIARQALKRDDLPELHDLDAEALLIILISLNRQLRRQDRRGDPTDRPRHAHEGFDEVPESQRHRAHQEVEEPF